MPADTPVRPEARAEAAPAPQRDLTLLDLINVVLRYRYSIVLVPLLFMALGVALSMSRPRTYMADAAFMLQGAGGDKSPVAGIAAQFGVSVPGGGSDVPQLYADLLESRRFLSQLAATRFDFRGDGRRHAGTLADILEVEGATPAEKERHALELLRTMVSAKVDPITGVVAFNVTSPWPALSEQMGARLLAMVSEFNLSTRQSQASAERKFTEARLNDARRELRAAEAALQGFLETNRRLENAPQLMIRRERLQREVVQQEAVYTMLSQAHERARIDEVRDTPVVTVIEGPAGSARAQSRETVIRGMLMLLLGLVVAVGWAFWRETLRVSRERQAPELGEYLRLRDETLGRRRKPAAAGG